MEALKLLIREEIFFSLPFPRITIADDPEVSAQRFGGLSSVRVVVFFFPFLTVYFKQKVQTSFEDEEEEEAAEALGCKRSRQLNKVFVGSPAKSSHCTVYPTLVPMAL